MAAIALSPVPDDVLKRLHRLAAEHGTDVQVEALHCLEKGLSEQEQIESELAELRALRVSGRPPLTDAMIRAARDEGRE